MFLSKYKHLAAGIAIGAIITSAVPVFAGNAVQAALTAVKFNFNGVEKQLPDGYAVLSYNDRTYVPARFVAENLNTDVAWDDATSTITFKTKGQSSNNGGLFSDLNNGSSNSGSSNSGSTNTGSSNTGSNSNWGNSNSGSGSTNTGSNSGNTDTGSSSGSIPAGSTLNANASNSLMDISFTQGKFSGSARAYDLNKTLTTGPVQMKIGKIVTDPSFDTYGFGSTGGGVILMEVEFKNTSSSATVEHVWGLDNMLINGKSYPCATEYIAGYASGVFMKPLNPGQSVHGYLGIQDFGNLAVNDVSSFKLTLSDTWDYDTNKTYADKMSFNINLNK